MNFELTNDQRKYLGLELISENWEKVPLKGDSYRPESILYFEGNIIKKQIISTEFKYEETQYHEITDNREFILPKTSKGRPRKLSSSVLESKTPLGVYFDFNPNGITIGNYNTQNTFYSTHFEDIKFDSIKDLPPWLDNYILNTTEQDLKSIEEFISKKRRRIKLKEGDFFKFKVDRKSFGFGRLICDIRKLRKEPEFKENKNYGLAQLMTQPLVIKIYHKISQSEKIDLDKLKHIKCIPPQYIMDNVLFYGDFEVIGNQPLEDWELDFPISYAKSINYEDPDTVYLQYGLIFREKLLKKFNKYIKIENENSKHDWDAVLKYNPYRKESIGADLDFNKKTLENCINENSNLPYWNDNQYEREFDLRNPKNEKIKKEIFENFSLDYSKSYAENLK